MISVLNPRRTPDANLRFNRLVCYRDTKGQIERRRVKRPNAAYIALCKSAFFQNPFGLSRARRGANTAPMSLRNTLRRGKLNAVKDSALKLCEFFREKPHARFLTLVKIHIPRYTSILIHISIESSSLRSLDNYLSHYRIKYVN